MSEYNILLSEIKSLISQEKLKPIEGLDNLTVEKLHEILSKYEHRENEKLNNMLFTGIINGTSLICRHKGIPHKIVDTVRETIITSESIVHHSSCVIGNVVPYIPLIGVTFGGMIIGKLLYNYYSKDDSVVDESNTQDTKL